MKEFWDDRYSNEEFAYGTDPSDYFKKKLPMLNVGKILFPADGEGRNSVYAAQLGWEVSAFDFSEKAKVKADKLAESRGVTIDYTVQSILEEKYKQAEFDAIFLSFVHFEQAMKQEMHKRLDGYLKEGGVFILEAFSREHREINRVNPEAGGPPDENMMYSIEDIKRDFKNYEIIELEKKRTTLKQGIRHMGEAAVIRFIGIKRGLSE
ncbi:class I SAM-dependent methyltransferase [Puteibacter caeruleilacunae]|nr:class I SAM-dependent methyltransferase [Puteibacter caeruleilacunae]